MNALVKCHRRSLALLFLLCLHAVAWGQPRASFTASTLSGCSPLVVHFTDSSTGNPTQWKWDLGNGVVSYLKNPSATYFNPGTYTVKLVASNAAGKDSVTQTGYITVYANPVIDFSFDKTTGCFPLPVTFSDKTEPGSGTISAWQWDFGDGTFSAEKNPAHTYTAAGTFSVTLRVTNSFGCVKSYTHAQAISITNGVKAAFSFTDPGACPAPALSTFTNTSTGPGPLRFQWQFGDGNTSNEINSTHTYTANGNYSVSLVATSPQGCADTVIKKDIFKIGSAKASFTMPGGICAGKPVIFTNTSSPTPVKVLWEFGDGTSSTAANGVKTYTQPGMYTVRLISSFGNCADTVSKEVTVSAKPTANFTATKQAFCKLPVTVSFTSTGATQNSSHAWDFGDGNTSASSDPTHIYTKEGIYTVKLVVTTAGGCSDTLVKKDLITVKKPQATLSGLPKTGCVPVMANPTAMVSAGHTITSYLWSFGDGTTSTEAKPSHTYTKAGTYDVSLVYTTANGCVDTVTYAKAVRAGEKPRADFVNQPLTVCPFEKVFFTDKSTGGVDQWFWDFDDGGTSTQQHPFHQFNDTGWQKVTLVVYNNTCPDTLVINKAVYVNPPVSIFAVKDDCNNKFAKQFTDKSMGPKTWLWEFGDGETSTVQHPLHTYAAAGVYTVKLTVTNGACTHFSKRDVKVIDEKAVFSTPDTIICRNSTATFTSTGINSKNILNWKWNFGTGASTADATKTAYTYTKSGTYNVSLVITDLLGCKSSSSVQVKVYGPTASFTPSVAATCLKDNEVFFRDASFTDGQHPIAKRVWNFGDATIDSTSPAPYKHSYTKAGTYAVTLTVEDDYGCKDSSRQPAAVIIAQPVASFAVSDTLSCTGKKIVFTNTSQGLSPLSVWTFGDGKTSTVASPSYTYATVGSYSIKLVVTDKYGCKDSITKPDLLTITYPKAGFTLSDSVGTCPPLLVDFTNKSENYKSIYWDFGDGSNSSLDAPSHFYSQAGTFYATLVATSAGGCTDTIRRKITVKGPTGTFTYTPLAGCKPLTVIFKASAKNSASFLWDFSDGATTVTKDSVVSHTYTTAGEFVPKIILTDAGGCMVPIEGKDTVRVVGITADFSMNATAFCNDGVVQFTNQTVSNDYIKSYQWQFGDGATSTATNPVHHYTKPGTYTVTLTATTQSGCTDTIILADSIKIYAPPIIGITGDSAACAPAAFTFNGVILKGDASQLTWNWNLANGQASALQNPVQQQYPTDGAYVISTVVTDNHGCRDTATRNVTVHPVPQTVAGADQWICRGSFQQLKATGAVTYSWKAAASLSCTDCDSPLAAPLDATQYVVTGSNSFGCRSSDSVTISVHQPFTLRVERGDTICVGKTINLRASGADQYTWTPSLDVKNPSAGLTTATPQTSTLYNVVAKDNAGCFTDTASVYIKVWSIPTVKTENAITLSVGNSIQIKPLYSADVTSYEWTNAQTLSCSNCPSPTAKPKTETTYSIAVKNDGGCTAKETVKVHVICNNGNLFIPNTFSPNTDGKNDRFYPRGTGISSIKSLKVFNRWGELVFSRESFNANDASAGWDGNFKGQVLAPDVYIYTCEVVCMNNEVLTYSGDVTLLR